MSAKIVIKANGAIIPAVLNDTAAAQDFKKRLPLSVSGRKSDMDFCCAAASGVFDPSETQSGWKNGDVSLADGWLAVLFDCEERSSRYRGMMIIAHIDEEFIPLVKKLPKSVRFTVELA